MTAPIATPLPAPPTAPPPGLIKRLGLWAALAALVAVLLLPTPADLPLAGHYMLAILAFAVIVWMTEALDYSVSAVVIGALMLFLLAYAPSAAKPGVTTAMGTGASLGLALSGFANSAVALVAAACFIASAMTATARGSSPLATTPAEYAASVSLRNARANPSAI